GLTLASKPTPTKVVLVDWVSDKVRAARELEAMANQTRRLVMASTYRAPSSSGRWVGRVSVNGPFIPDSVPTVVVEFVNLRYMRVALLSAGWVVMVASDHSPTIMRALYPAPIHSPPGRPGAPGTPPPFRLL